MLQIKSVLGYQFFKMDIFPSKNYEKLESKFSSSISVCSSESEVLEESVNIVVTNSTAQDHNITSVIHSNQIIDSLDVNTGEGVHVGNKFHCASVHFYEAAKSLKIH